MKNAPTPRFSFDLPPALLAQVGQVVARAASRLQTAWPDAPEAASVKLAELEQLGLQLQEVVRMLASPACTGAEQVDLGLALLQARAEWAGALHQRGLSWDGPDHSVDVMVNAAVLKQLVDLAIGHLLELGRQLVVDTRLCGLTGQLHIAAHTPGAAMFSAMPDDGVECQWRLPQALATHAGAQVERQVQAQGVEVVLSWPAVGSLRPLSPRGMP